MALPTPEVKPEIKYTKVRNQQIIDRKTIKK